MVLGLIRRRTAPARRICVIHAGMPKTGSSALQTWLARNARALRRLGVLYPAAGRRNGGVEHGDLARAITGRTVFHDTAGMPGELDREIAATPHEVLVISSEYLRTPLYFAPVPHLQQFLGERGYAIHVVLYIRDAPDMLNAVYTQMVKTGWESGAFEDFMADRLRRPPPPGGLMLHLDALRDPGAWGRHHFQPYDAVRRRGIEADFAGLLAGIASSEGVAPGLTAEALAALPPAERVNESCGPVQVAVSRRIARAIAPRFTHKELIRASVGLSDIVAAEVRARAGAEPRYAALTRRRYRQVRRRLSEENDRFALAVWDRPWAAVFPEPDLPALVSNDIDETGDEAARAMVADLLAVTMPKVEALIETRMRKGLV